MFEKSLGKKISPKEIALAFHKAEKWLISKKNAGKMINEKEQFQYQELFFQELGIKGKRAVNELNQELLESLTYEFELEEGIKKLFNELKKRDIAIGIISNWDESFYSILEDLEILNSIKTITVSYDVGYNKPHPEIYLAASQRYKKIKKKEILFVSSNYERDIQTAMDLDWNCILYEKGDDSFFGIPEVKYPKCPVVNDLSSIIDRL